MNSTQAMETWTRLREGEDVSAQDQDALKEWLSSKDHRRTFQDGLMLEGHLSVLLSEMPHMASKETVDEPVTPTMPRETSTLSPTLIDSYHFPWKAVGSIAALLILTFSLYYMGELFQPSDKEIIGKVFAFDGNPKVERNSVKWPAILSLKSRAGDRVVTDSNSHLELELEDGSLLWLGPNSSLLVSSDFELSQRLRLESGSLHLEVEKRQQPLLVSMDTMTIEVLGTRFSVKHRISDGLEQVHLQEGRVSVSLQEKHEHLLEPGQVAQLTKGEPFSISDKTPFKIAEGKVLSVSPTHLKLIEPEGERHSFKLPRSNPELTHRSDLSFKPIVGQNLKVTYIDGPNRIIHLKPLNPKNRATSL